MKKVHISGEQIKEHTRLACERSGYSQEFFVDFWNRLMERQDIYKEYVTYLVTGDFPGQVKVEGYQVVDVLIWQMDRFKAKMDTDTYDTKQDKTKMILSAFDTFLKMAKEPEVYVAKMREDTGTDYPDKF